MDTDKIKNISNIRTEPRALNVINLSERLYFTTEDLGRVISIFWCSVNQRATSAVQSDLWFTHSRSESERINKEGDIIILYCLFDRRYSWS